MTVLAVSPHAVVVNPTREVDAARHGLKVIRVDTSPHPAEVVKVEAVGDLSA